MLDLRYALPTSLNVGGEPFAVETDFRIWLNWLKVLQTEHVAGYEIFTEAKPRGTEWVQSAIDFAVNKPATPNYKNAGTGVELFDFILDGEYIVGSFMQVYGIDLTSIEYMHWHLFLALFRSLPDNCKMSQIMGYRGYNPASSKKRPERIYQEQKDAWSIVTAKDKQQDEELLAWADAFFGDL